jgi:hypothetical protein
LSFGFGAQAKNPKKRGKTEEAKRNVWWLHSGFDTLAKSVPAVMFYTPTTTSPLLFFQLSSWCLASAPHGAQAMFKLLGKVVFLLLHLVGRPVGWCLINKRP